MKSLLPTTRFSPITTFFIYILIIFLLLTSGSCNFIAPDEEKNIDTSVNETLVALSVEQTLAAQNNNQAGATIAAQQATIQAQSAQTTAQAQQPPPAQVTIPAPQETQPVVINTQPAPPSNPPAGNFNEQMKNAQILLFEDVISDPSKSRYVKQTLDSMGLRYKDDGNAIGWLKNDLLYGSPTGQPWDLVILAIEERERIRGIFRISSGCSKRRIAGHP